MCDICEAADAYVDAQERAQDGRQAASPAGVASVPTVDAVAVLREHVYDEAAPPSRNARVISVPICESCGEPWRGDAETGGCEAVLLARRVALLEGLLREVQHHAHWGTCSVCGWHRDHGHAPDCRLATAPADGG